MKIGIITMHRVKNIGSVLQAYATQRAFEKLGYDSELVDYMYAPTKKLTVGTVVSTMQSFVLNILLGFPMQKYRKRLQSFFDRYFKCSPKSYNQDTILKNPPQYDIYCTGSDQVWNPRYIDKDITFMLGFAPKEAKRIAYASSFATDNVPSEYESLYSEHLSKYNSISVREQSGVDISRHLTRKEAKLVCDPTLLLDAHEWDKISESSEVHIDKPYILVYFLGYMFDPRPHLFDIVNDVQQKLGLPVYYINGGHQEMKQPNSKVLRGLGPAEFIELIRNATFLVTDSFHGTAFATIYNIPMIGVVKSSNSGDDRIGTLRKKVQGCKSIVQYDTYDKSFIANNIDNYKCNPKSVKNFREESLLVIKQMVED